MKIEPNTISRISLTKLFGKTMLPFLVLIIAYELFSEQSLSEVFSIRNWTNPAPSALWMIVGNVCTVIAISGLLYWWSTIIRSKGRIVWINDGYLMDRTKRVFPLIEIDDDKCIIESNMRTDFIGIFNKRGDSKFISLFVADGDAESILSRIRSLPLDKD